MRMGNGIPLVYLLLQEVE